MTVTIAPPPLALPPEPAAEVRPTAARPAPSTPTEIADHLIARIDAREASAPASIHRRAFVERFSGKAVDLGRVGRSSLAPPVVSAIGSVDADRDGRVQGAEVDRLFTRLNHYDQDGHPDTMRLSRDGRPLAMGLILDVLSEASAPAPAPAPAPAASSALHAKLHAWYGQRANYDRVRAAVGSTRNMCAMFVTTALEKSGALSIPAGTRYPGYDDDGVPKHVRAWAPSLANYLENVKGWQRVYGFAAMKPGDLLFTHGAEGTYNHVMMLESWIDQGAGLARVIDNQGFMHARHLSGASGQSKVAYAVRAP
jgi:hypothetical protein